MIFGFDNYRKIRRAEKSKITIDAYKTIFSETEVILITGNGKMKANQYAKTMTWFLSIRILKMNTKIT